MRRRRDALLFAALAVVAAVAAADAVFRGGGEDTQPAANRPEPRAPTAPAAATDAPHGTLLYTDAACIVHELDLASRAGAPVAPTAEGCYGLWAAPDGSRFAYADWADGDSRTMLLRLRIREPGQPSIDIGPYEVRRGSVVTSADGRVGWCDPSGRGEVVVPPADGALRLAACPAAFTARGAPVYLSGREVVFGRTAVRSLHEPAWFASAGPDGSLAVVTPRRASLYRPADNPEPVGTVLVPPFRDRPLFAPDNCAVALPSRPRDEPPAIRVRGLPCTGAPRPWTFPGFDAAWSPDGRWIAVTDGVAVLLYSVHDPARDPVRLRVRAAYVAWTRR